MASLIFLCLGGCLGTGQIVDEYQDGPHRVLFIGNSLTYTNDLPRTLAAVAASGGDTLTTAAVALPNFALIDHALGGSPALTAIQGGDWEFVLLQQGPTWPGLCLDTLVLATRIFDEAIRAVGAHTALLMTWPPLSDSSGFSAVQESYRTAAQAVGALLLPAGEAWRTAWRSDPTLTLYGSDQFHPSALGTYLTALVLYEQLTGHDARGLPPDAVVAGHRLELPEATIRLLQRSAHQTNLDFRLNPAGTSVATPPRAAVPNPPGRRPAIRPC